MSEQRNCVITMTHYKRPDYTRRSLAALAKCEGIAQCTLVLHAEPGNDEVVDLLNAVDFCERRVVVNPERIKADPNTVGALDHGFTLSDFAIHVEDDILLAPDALDYFWWARAFYHHDQKVGSISGYNRNADAPHPAYYHDVRRLSWFHPWGVGLWRDRYAKVRPHILDICGVSQTHQGLRVNGRGLAGRDSPWGKIGGGWDGAHGWYAAVQGLNQPYPTLSRVQNIGAVSSIHHDPQGRATWFTPEWHAKNQRVNDWAGDGRPVANGKWIDIPEVPSRTP